MKEKKIYFIFLDRDFKCINVLKFYVPKALFMTYLRVVVVVVLKNLRVKIKN